MIKPLKLLYLLPSLLILIFLSNCTQREKEETGSELITIPFSEAKPLIYSDLIDKQDFVLLSTEADALFNRVDKVIAKNNKFYLFDHLSNKGILVFDDQGNYLQTVGEIGEGPQQQMNIDDFQVSQAGEVLILNKLAKKIVIYDSDGLWKEETSIPVNSGGFALMDDMWFFAINYDHQSDGLVKNQKFGVFDQDMEIDSMYFHYPEDAGNANLYYHSGIVSANSKAVIFHRPPNDTISVFSQKGELNKRMIIDFGDSNLPEDVVFDFQKLQEYNQENSVFQYLQTPATLVNDHLFGMISSTKNDIWMFALNIESHELFVDRIDFSQFHLKDLVLASANLNDNTIVSLIDPASFSQDTKPESYPEEVRQHLENEGTVLILHTLKQ